MGLLEWLALVFVAGLILLFVLLPELFAALIVLIALCRRVLFPPPRVPVPGYGEEIERIRSKIVRYVDQHPQVGAMTLAQLRQAAAITAEDEQRIEHLQFHPISAASPDDAIMLVRTQSDFVTRWHKGIECEKWTFQASGDKNFSFFYPYPGQNENGVSRTRTLVDNRSGQTVYAYRTDRESIEAGWGRDGLAVATIERNCAGDKEMIVLVLIDGRVKELRIPAEINTLDWVPGKYRRDISALDRQQVTSFTWFTDHMSIDWVAHAPRLEDGVAAGEWVIRRCIKLGFDAVGNVRVIDRGNASVRKVPAQ